MNLKHRLNFPDQFLVTFDGIQILRRSWNKSFRDSQPSELSSMHRGTSFDVSEA